MLKILITGPECSGKTSLGVALAQHFRSPLIPELSRAYLTVKSSIYQQEDLTQIARNQLALEDSCAGLSVPYLFIDTSMLVLQIWSKYRFVDVDDFITTSLNERSYDVCFLCQPVEPYVPEALRENPDDRWSLYFLYLKQLWLKKNKPQILKGDEEQRFEAAISLLNEMA